MKKLQLIFISISLLAFSFVNAQEKSDSTSVEENLSTGNLIVRLLDFSSDEGKAMTALYNSEDGYNSNNAYKVFSVEIKNGVVEYTFENVPFGTYAIKCYHDENENHELDTNMLGIPSEDYGFSNNARGSFGPAEYEDAKFEFTKDNQVIEINLD